MYSMLYINLYIHIHCSGCESRDITPLQLSTPRD